MFEEAAREIKDILVAEGVADMPLGIDVVEPPFLFVPVTEALRPEAARLQVVGCADEPMDLPYGWPDEARVEALRKAMKVEPSFGEHVKALAERGRC